MAALMLLAAGMTALVFGPSTLRAPSDLTGPAIAIVDKWIATHGLGIEQVSLQGHRFTPDSDIFDALDLPNAGSMLRFNGTEAGARILRLPWIQRVQIKPQVPNGLQVVVTERTPYAVWEHEGPVQTPAGPAGQNLRRQLIDQGGRVLATIGPNAFSGLPRVRGEGAPVAAADLHATLALFPVIAQRLLVAERVGERRWVLVLDRGLRIHLPAEHEATAMQSLAALQASHQMLERDVMEIDLRAPGFTVRPRAHSPVAGGSSRGVPQM
jgi:cell division protein FtsQ